MQLNFYLAQVPPPSPANAAQVAADIVAAQWDATWKDFFTGAVYSGINNSMLGVALIFLCITTTKTIIEWMNSNDDVNFTKLFAPFLVIIFLMNNGKLGETTILAIRGVGNIINKTIVTKVTAGEALTARFSGQMVEQEALSRIKTQMNACTNEAAGTPAQAACLDEMERIIKEEQTAGRIKDPGLLGRIGAAAQKWADAKDLAVLQGAAAGNAVGGIGGAALGAAAGGIGSFIGDAVNAVGFALLDPITVVISLILLAMTSAVQHMTEASLLLTALIAPIFLTAALLPNGSKAIVTLLTAFWSIINFKICYTIIVVLTNSLISSNDRNSLITLGLCTAIFSPVLAGILAAGSGMGFAKAASSAAGQVAGFAGSAALGAVTGGAGTAAQAVVGIATKFLKK